MKELTEQQLADFHKYEAIRSSGFYNMLSPQAISAVDIPLERYKFVLLNYSKLSDAILKDKQERAK